MFCVNNGSNTTLFLCFCNSVYSLQLTLDKIEKNFGKGSIMKLGDNEVEDIPVIPSGSIALDGLFCPDAVSFQYLFLRVCNQIERKVIFRNEFQM